MPLWPGIMVAYPDGLKTTLCVSDADPSLPIMSVALSRVIGKFVTHLPLAAPIATVTRLPSSDASTASIVASIRDRLFSLDDETLVHPGHGPRTTIRDEKRSNPFLRNLGGS